MLGPCHDPPDEKETIMPRLECAKLFEGCPGVVEAETTEEVMVGAAAHAAEAHGLETLDAATVAAVRAAIEPA
jgi:predicted small metal-binding protein